MKNILQGPLDKCYWAVLLLSLSGLQGTHRDAVSGVWVDVISFVTSVTSAGYFLFLT